MGTLVSEPVSSTKALLQVKYLTDERNLRTRKTQVRDAMKFNLIVSQLCK